MDQNEKARRMIAALETEAQTLMQKGNYRGVAAIMTFLGEAQVGSFARLYDAIQTAGSEQS